VDPQLRSLDGRETGGMIDPRPKAGSLALTGGETLPNDGFFESAVSLAPLVLTFGWKGGPG